MDSLVTSEWLAAERGAPDLRIVDASWFLPEHQRDPRAEFEVGHIPGAVFLDLAELADTASSLPQMLPPPEKFASRMQGLGLGDGTRIVLYDDSPLHSAARAWWMLRRYGVRGVAILDRGLAGWKAEGRPLEVGTAAPKPRHFTIREPRAQRRTLAEMQANLLSQAEQVADARSPARFAGAEPEPRPGLVPGHIPGSLNLHYARIFDADGRWKRGDALRAAFVDAGVDPDRPVAVTCGSGVTAAVLVFGLHLLGRDAALYDGSWAEWGSDPETPKATGTA
jgi:thiosulfate/3-mercaptopyruvate sulfurtransferase